MDFNVYVIAIVYVLLASANQRQLEWFENDSDESEHSLPDIRSVAVISWPLSKRPFYFRSSKLFQAAVCSMNLAIWTYQLWRIRWVFYQWCWLPVVVWCASEYYSESYDSSKLGWWFMSCELKFHAQLFAEIGVLGLCVVWTSFRTSFENIRI